MPQTDPVRITIEVDDRGTVKIVSLGKEAEKAFDRTSAAADRAGQRGRRALDEIGERAAPRATQGLGKAQVAATALVGGLTGMGGAATRAATALSTLLFTGFNPIALAIAGGSVALGAWISQMEESKEATKRAAEENKAFEQTLVEIDQRIRAIRTGDDPAIVAARDARDKARREFASLEEMVKRLEAAAFPEAEVRGRGGRFPASDRPGDLGPGFEINAAFAPRPETLARLAKLGEELRNAQRLLDALTAERAAEKERDEVEELADSEERAAKASIEASAERAKAQGTLLEQLRKSRQSMEDQIATAIRLEAADPTDSLTKGWVEFDETLRRSIRDFEEVAGKIEEIGGEDENLLPPLAVAGFRELVEQLRALERARVGAARAGADAEKTKPAQALISDLESEIDVLDRLAETTDTADREFITFSETLEDRVGAAVRALNASGAQGVEGLVDRLEGLREELLRAKEIEIEARRRGDADTFVRELEREGATYRRSLTVVDDYTRALEELNAEEARAMERPGLRMDEQSRIVDEFGRRRAALAAAEFERPFVEEAAQGADAFMDTLAARILDRRLDLEDLGREVSNIIARGMIEALLEATIGDSVRNAFLEIFRAIPAVLGFLGGGAAPSDGGTGTGVGAGGESLGDPSPGAGSGTAGTATALTARGPGEPAVVVNLVNEPPPVVVEEVFNRLPAEARRGFVSQAITTPGRSGRRSTE